MKITKTIPLLLLGILSFFLLQAKDKPAPIIIRVKLQSISAPVILVADGLAWRTERESGRSDRLQLGWEAGHFSLNGRPVFAVRLSITAPGPISVDGHRFRGSLLALARPSPILVNEVDLESYVAGVLNREMDSRWPPAALDAQAILARTYALKHQLSARSKDFDLDRTVEDQVYGGMEAEDVRVWQAVERTRGMVLTYEGKLILPNYHACCGGRTELPSAVWPGLDEPWQKSVPCPYCQNAPRFFWRFPALGEISGRELASLLGLPREVEAVKVLDRTATGRAAKVKVSMRGNDFWLSGLEFRRQIGYDRLFSTAFEVSAEGRGFVFRGSGAGHGVGLCQWGAKGMAEKGFSVSPILQYYYPGVKVGRWTGR